MSVGERVRELSRWWYIAGFAVVFALAVAAIVVGDDPGEAGVGTTTSTTTSASTTSTTTTRVESSSSRPSSTMTTSTTQPTRPIDLDGVYALDVDEDDPAVVARPIPDEPSDAPPPSTVAPPPWASSTRTTLAGYVGVDVGCATDLSADGLDTFFAQRAGPVLGWDYQHAYPLGGDRYLWLFQDAFLDHTGTVTNLGSSRFVHNIAMVQKGRCFTLLHQGTTAKPAPFEPGDGTGDVRTKWFWPMGGELVDGTLQVFWVAMVKDSYDPSPPDGLGWHPQQLFLATYDPTTMRRLSFVPAPDPGVTPIYGYAVASDASHTYLFGNTFEQNLVREGGFWNGPHSATQMWLARVPLGQLTAPPEYRTADGWSPNRGDAVPFLSRFYAENPMQPRYFEGQWVAATDVDGYWGDALAVDVAPAPWGPWTTVEYFGLQPRNNDPRMNTYHAHVLPWRDSFGSLIIAVSNNARDMLRDAWPRPDRYRPMVIYSAWRPVPPPPPATTTVASTTTSTSTTTTTTTAPPATTTTTVPATTTTPTTSTTVPPTTSSTTTTTSTTSTSSTTTSSTAPPTSAPG